VSRYIEERHIFQASQQIKHGYSCGPEIFKAIEAIGALQREATVKEKDMAAGKKFSGMYWWDYKRLRTL
jgi:hypothetical protein